MMKNENSVNKREYPMQMLRIGSKPLPEYSGEDLEKIASLAEEFFAGVDAPLLHSVGGPVEDRFEAMLRLVTYMLSVSSIELGGFHSVKDISIEKDSDGNRVLKMLGNEREVPCYDGGSGGYDVERSNLYVTQYDEQAYLQVCEKGTPGDKSLQWIQADYKYNSALSPGDGRFIPLGFNPCLRNPFGLNGCFCVHITKYGL